jgi:hypothetical protein
MITLPPPCGFCPRTQFSLSSSRCRNGASNQSCSTGHCPTNQRQGLGVAVVTRAIAEAQAAGCEWLFVDFGRP